MSADFALYTLFVRPSLITGKTSNKRRPPITPKSWTYCNIGVCNHELSSTDFSTYNNIYEIGGGVTTISNIFVRIKISMPYQCPFKLYEK